MLSIPLQFDISAPLTFISKISFSLGLLLHLRLPRLYAVRLAQPVTPESFQILLPSLILEWKILNFSSAFLLSYVVIYLRGYVSQR